MSRLDPRTVRRLNHMPGVVDHATPARITWNRDFARAVAYRTRHGASPAKLFRQAGVGSEIIGYKRIERCVARWKSEYPEDGPADLAGTDEPALEETIGMLAAHGADDITMTMHPTGIMFRHDGCRYRLDADPETDAAAGSWTTVCTLVRTLLALVDSGAAGLDRLMLPWLLDRENAGTLYERWKAAKTAGNGGGHHA